MKVILTFDEIRTKFGLSDDCELEVVETAVKKDSYGCWINVPSDHQEYSCPISLSDYCKIEVIYRDGEFDDGYCSQWTSSWCQDGSTHDIVKYRIVGE